MRCTLLIFILLFPLCGFTQNNKSWVYDGNKTISEYKISNQVKKVGRHAFDSCVNLQTVHIPENVTEFELYAFKGCPSLKTFIVDPRNKNFCTIDGVLYSSDLKTLVCCPNARATNDFIIPEKVTTIAGCAFFEAENLTEITIPDQVEVIGFSAFEKCVNITSVYIPASVREIQGCAFSTCYKLQKIEVDPNNKYFTSIDGVLYNHDKTKLISCPNLSEYTIPSSVKIIGEYAFQGCKNLKSVTIPNSVEIIEEGAFSYCDGLTSIDIPQSVREIGGSAFWNSENLRTVNLTDGVETIGEGAFLSCTSLRSISIPPSAKEIGDYLCQKCYSLETITLENDYISEYAFSKCNNLTSVVIPSNIKAIGTCAFWDCPNLVSVSIAEGVQNISRGSFYECKKLETVSIPGSVSEIEPLTFAECENLRFVSIGNGVEIISANSFRNCRNITSITLPKSIKVVGDDVFPNLKSVAYDGEESVLQQLMAKKCLADAYKINGQYDSTQSRVLKMIDIFHSNQTIDARCLPFYKDITNYYTLTGDFEKVKKYCAEGLSRDFSDIDSSIEKQYWENKHYFALQLADVCINLKEYDEAKSALQQFEANYFKSDSTKIGTTSAVSSIISKDADLGTYYYYLLLKLYYQLIDGDNLLKYTNNSLLYDARRKSSLYVNNAMIYWLKIKVGLFNYLRKTDFEKYKTELNNDLAKYGMNNSGFNEIYTVIGDCHYHYKEIDSAFAYYSKSFEYELERLKANFSFMNTFQRQNYWDEHRFSFDNITKITAKMPDNKDAVEMAYNALLVSKGLILASEQNLTNTIQTSNDENLKNDFFSLKHYRAQLDTIKDGNSRDSLRTIIERLETDLMQRSSQFADIVGYMNIDWQKVKKSLGNKDVAIEFFYDNDSLYALVLRRDFDVPKLVKLGSFDYKTPFNGSRNVAEGNSYSTFDIYNAVWKPLEKYFSTAGKVYFSPSGKLYNIAIEYAPMDDTHLISEKYKIFRISSTRYLALNQTNDTGKKSAAVFGGIEYNFGKGDWEDLKNLKNENDRMVAFRDVPIINADSTRAGVTFLPGTKIEAENVANSLRAAQYDVKVETDMEATEDSFKELSGSGLKILHIGTHGFYEPSKVADDNGMTKEDRSLSQSGLLLAGANSALDPEKRKDIPNGVDDGILTAKEISRLDFKGLDLVVLSACQTGLGEVTGEGVFGLQRGFKKAGAQTIVMSLWSVSDEATQLLMTEFFKNLTSGQTKRVAFLAAQEVVRRKYPDPKYWAAFIIVDGLD